VYRVSSILTLQELSAVAADPICEGIPVDRVVAADEDCRYSAEYLGHLLDLPDAAPVLAASSSAS
jgi:hypothetical protein